MTELDLFPRGKTPTDKSLSSSNKKKPSDDTRASSNDLKKGRKRKAVGSPPPKAGEQDRDFLFGAPQTKPTQVPGKQSPGDSKARQHGLRSSSGQEKVGKLEWCHDTSASPFRLIKATCHLSFELC